MLLELSQGCASTSMNPSVGRSGRSKGDWICYLQSHWWGAEINNGENVVRPFSHMLSVQHQIITLEVVDKRGDNQGDPVI
jgi:hypothetical protein